MPASEFTLIEKYFTRKQNHREDVLLGIGDDGAITRAPADQLLVTTVDTLVEGTHFFSHSDAFDIGFKAAAVNLSDIAAMGGVPASLLFSLGFPKTTIKSDVDDFYKGVKSALKNTKIKVIGGDLSSANKWTIRDRKSVV